MADYVTQVQAPVGSGVYLTPLGGVMYTDATDLSDAVDGNWTIAQFDSMGNLRVTSSAGLWNGVSEEPQLSDGYGQGKVSDPGAQHWLKGIYYELVYLRRFMVECQQNPAADYVEPLYAIINTR